MSLTNAFLFLQPGRTLITNKVVRESYYSCRPPTVKTSTEGARPLPNVTPPTTFFSAVATTAISAAACCQLPEIAVVLTDRVTRAMKITAAKTTAVAKTIAIARTTAISTAIAIVRTTAKEKMIAVASTIVVAKTIGKVKTIAVVRTIVRPKTTAVTRTIAIARMTAVVKTTAAVRMTAETTVAGMEDLADGTKHGHSIWYILHKKATSSHSSSYCFVEAL